MKRIIELINTYDNMAIFTHVNPDSDALGSSIALKLAVESLGKKATIYLEDYPHDNYNFFNIEKHCKFKYKNANHDLAIVLDCPQLKRIGEYTKVFKRFIKTIKIDHHASNECFADENLVESKTDSTCTILYKIFNKMDIEITKEIAAALYAGIAGDTGCFMHSNTSSDTHRVCADLIDRQINLEKINFNLFKRRSVAQARLYSNTLANMRYFYNNQIAIAVITKDDYKKYGASVFDTYGIAQFMVGIDGIKISVVLTEKNDNQFIVSLRSENFDISKIATHFGGGGHKKAAGCCVLGSSETCVKKIIEQCETAIREV